MRTDFQRFCANRATDRTILSTYDGDYTLNDVLLEADKYASFLQNRAEMRGRKVVLLVPYVFPFLSLCMAVNRLGGTIAPLGTQYRNDDLRAVLEYLEPEVIFTIDNHHGFSFADVVEEWAFSSGKCKTVYRTEECRNWEQKTINPDLQKAEANESLPDMIFCTSGSTGTPKGLAVNLDIFTFPLMIQMLDLKASDRVFINPPFNSIVGFATIVSAIEVGYRVVYPETFDILRMIGLMRQSSCNKALSTPSIFKAIYSFAEQTNPQAVRQIECCGLAGEMIPDRYADSFDLMKDATFVGIYGCSEVGGVLQRNLREETDWTICNGVEAIIDEQNDAGELLVRSPFMFTEYYNHPDLTRESLTTNKWFKTGDLAVFADGGRIRIVGRKKDLIKKGGQQVNPGEVEQILSHHPNVRQAVVFGAPHAVFGEQIVALVLPEGQVDREQLYRHCKEKIAGYKVPDVIDFIHEIPMIQGKVDKRTLRDAFVAQMEGVQS